MSNGQSRPSLPMNRGMTCNGNKQGAILTAAPSTGSGQALCSLRGRRGRLPDAGAKFVGIVAVLLGLLTLCLLSTGCSTPKKTAPHLTGDPLVDGPEAIAHGPERDRVLWQYRT